MSDDKPDDEQTEEEERKDLQRLFSRPVIHNTPIQEQMRRMRDHFETTHFDVEMPELTPDELQEYESEMKPKEATL
jgi:lipoate-protein ligase A